MIGAERTLTMRTVFLNSVRCRVADDACAPLPKRHRVGEAICSCRTAMKLQPNGPADPERLAKP